PQPPLPCCTVSRNPLDDPVPDLISPEWQEAAGLDGRILPLGCEPLDDELPAIEPPDLGDAQCGIDPGAVDLGPGDIDLDRQVGVGIVGDILGIALPRR